ncbi:MAG: SoxR reducing system RseC family protein [Proteobacteria bacterium]|nr:SoxR reducing system RseC family protein [Pseudomonadota bacterium]
MIEEQAQVVEIRGAQLILQAQTQSACGSCSASKGCGTSVLAKVVGRKFTRFQAENNIDAEVGDTVVVGISEDALLKGSLVMYVIPILGMLLFALAADYFFVAVMDYRDLAIAASGIMGLVFGSLMSKWYFQRQSSAQSFTPVVLRKIIEHGKL